MPLGVTSSLLSKLYPTFREVIMCALPSRCARSVTGYVRGLHRSAEMFDPRSGGLRTAASDHSWLHPASDTGTGSDRVGSDASDRMHRIGSSRVGSGVGSDASDRVELDYGFRVGSGTAGRFRGQSSEVAVSAVSIESSTLLGCYGLSLGVMGSLLLEVRWALEVSLGVVGECSTRGSEHRRSLGGGSGSRSDVAAGYTIAWQAQYVLRTKR